MLSVINKFRKVKNTLVVLTLVLVLSCNKEKSKIDFDIECDEETKVDSKYSDAILIETCKLKKHLFKSIGTPDFKGRYSYEYQLFKINKNDTIKINNSEFFNDDVSELEKSINDKLKTEYKFNLSIPELSDCMKWINFRYYKLNEFGISFTGKNKIRFSIDYGIGSACFNVNSSYVDINISEIESYL